MAHTFSLEELIGKNVEMQILKELYKGIIAGIDPKDNLFVKLDIDPEDFKKLQPGAIASVFFTHGWTGLYNFAARVEALSPPRKEIGIRLISEIEKIQRRRTFRLDVQIPVRFTALDPEEKGNKQAPSEWREGETVDLSAGGSRILTDAPLKQGERVKVEFDVPPGEKVHAIAEVLRAPKADGETGKYVVVLRFLSINELDSQAIVSFINRELISRTKFTRTYKEGEGANGGIQVEV